MVSADEVRALYPQLRADDVLGGAFCPTDGFVDPYSAMVGFTQWALERGAQIQRSTEVTGIDVENGRVTGVHTSKEAVAAPVVVNAAGPWAAGVAQLAGAELPVVPLRRMLVPTEPFDRFPHSAPMIIDMSNGFHFRPEARGFLLAWNDPEERPGFNADYEPSFTEKILTRAADRVPCFADVPVNPKRAWAGLYEVSPDHHSILGESPEVKGLFFANGFSGHGVMHAPATGKILSDLILRGTTDLIDARVLRPGRFAAGELIHETAVL
jgi:sarcosine oxidase subunit beta